MLRGNNYWLFYISLVKKKKKKTSNLCPRSLTSVFLTASLKKKKDKQYYGLHKRRSGINKVEEACCRDKCKGGLRGVHM